MNDEKQSKFICPVCECNFIVIDEDDDIISYCPICKEFGVKRVEN